MRTQSARRADSPRSDDAEGGHPGRRARRPATRDRASRTAEAPATVNRCDGRRRRERPGCHGSNLARNFRATATRGPAQPHLGRHGHADGRVRRRMQRRPRPRPPTTSSPRWRPSRRVVEMAQARAATDAVVVDELATRSNHWPHEPRRPGSATSIPHASVSVRHGRRSASRRPDRPSARRLPRRTVSVSGNAPTLKHSTNFALTL
jgi:hypothetical protein